MKLEALITDDYRSVYLSHSVELMKVCDKVFATYPNIEEIGFGQQSLRVEGVSFTRTSSVHTKSQDHYSSRTESKYNFYALIEDQDKQIHKIQTVIDNLSDFFKAFALFTQNPIYKTMIASDSSYEVRHLVSKANKKETFEKVFGAMATNYYFSLTEKNKLESAILPVPETSILTERKSVLKL